MGNSSSSPEGWRIMKWSPVTERELLGRGPLIDMIFTKRMLPICVYQAQEEHKQGFLAFCIFCRWLPLEKPDSEPEDTGTTNTVQIDQIYKTEKRVGRVAKAAGSCQWWASITAVMINGVGGMGTEQGAIYLQLETWKCDQQDEFYQEKNGLGILEKGKFTNTFKY